MRELTVYREAPPSCARCAELEREIRRLKGNGDVEPCPYSAAQSDGPPDTAVRCPRCTSLSGTFPRSKEAYSSDPYGYIRYRWVYDVAIHVGERRGFFWLHKCPEIPHRHRACTNCGHAWIEHAHPPEWRP